MVTLGTPNFEFDFHMPIIRNGFDIDELGRKWAKWKSRGDFILTIKGSVDKISLIESEIRSIFQK